MNSSKTVIGDRVQEAAEACCGEAAPRPASRRATQRQADRRLARRVPAGAEEAQRQLVVGAARAVDSTPGAPGLEPAPERHSPW